MSRREYENIGEYSHLEYLETNTNQYIDTGRIVHSNTEYWEFDYQPLSVEGRPDYNTAVPGGIYQSSNNKYWQCNYNASYGKPRAMWGGSTYDKYVIATSDKYKRVLYKCNSKKLRVNDVEYALGSANVVDSTITMTLFVRHTNTGRDYTAQNVQRMWRTTVYDLNGNILANYIPMLRNADRKPGLLETVSGTFLTNIGAGEFGYKMTDGTIVAPIKG